MTPERPMRVSVIEPISPAIERVKTILFSPFDLRKWFIIGFCAWLAFLGSGGGGNGGGRFNYSYKDHKHDAHQAFDEAKDFILVNLHWIIPLAVLAVVVGIILWLVITWLSSRGRFMFLHCVAENKAEVKIPWAKFRQHANSLFLFRILLGLIGFAVIGLPVILVVGFIIMMIASEGPVFIGVLGGVVIGLIIFVFIIIFSLIRKFTMDFVVPIMFLRTTSCRAGWREFLRVLSLNKVRFFLYILFQIVIGIAISAIVITGMCITCCCACCILAIPYIGTVLLLPLLVFERAYSLYYLRQFGPEFDVFGPETTVALID